MPYENVLDEQLLSVLVRIVGADSGSVGRRCILDELKSKGKLLIAVALTMNLVFGIFLLASVSIQPAFASFPGTNGKIAFMSSRDGDLEIYVMNADGSGPTRLTNSPRDDSFPDWSPDGSKIAFHSDRDGNMEVYVMNADGSGQTRLTNSPGPDDYPDWQRLRVGAVGGVLMPASSLKSLAPYTALVGIIAAVAVAVTTKRRREA